MMDLQAHLDALAADIRTRTDRGKVTRSIEALGAADPGQFGIAVAFCDGRCFVAGDAEQSFSVQSISKVFTLTLALGAVGDELWLRVGREPSDEAFNSIVQLERERGVPRNPFVNAGALVVADVLLASREPREILGEIVRFIRFLAEDEDIAIDERVAKSERQRDFRNIALANYLKDFENLRNAPDRVLGVYAHHCAISMTCRQLATAGRFLACGGRNPGTGFDVVSSERARRINALMLTCGQYEGSGEFAFRVGLPAKSGIGGGVLAIVPGVASIATWSPGLNPSGNSLLGCQALEHLSRSLSWSVF